MLLVRTVKSYANINLSSLEMSTESSSHKLSDTKQQQTEGTQGESEGQTDPIFSRVPT